MFVFFNVLNNIIMGVVWFPGAFATSVFDFFGWGRDGTYIKHDSAILKHISCCVTLHAALIL